MKTQIKGLASQSMASDAAISVLRTLGAHSRVREILIMAAALCCLPSMNANAQEFPTKPVKIVTGFSAGSGPDAVLRVLADQLSRSWGQPVIVDNKPGASGILAGENVKRAPADGYTLIQMDNAQLTALPHLMKRWPLDAARDFRPVASQYRVNFFITTAATSPWRSVRDLLVQAKKLPGKLTYGSWYVGSPGHLGGLQLEAGTSTSMLHVPYKEVGQLYTAVSTGEVDWALGSAASVGQLRKAGKLRFLAVAGSQRLPGFEDVPAVAEAGGPSGFEAGGWVAILAPHGVPDAIVSRLNSDINKVTSGSQMRSQLAAFGFTPDITTAKELAERITEESAHQAAIIKRASLSID